MTALESLDDKLRLPQLQRVIPLSKARIYALIKQGILPAPIAIAPNAVAWRRTDIESYLSLMAERRALKRAGVKVPRKPAPSFAGLSAVERSGARSSTPSV